MKKLNYIPGIEPDLMISNVIINIQQNIGQPNYAKTKFVFDFDGSNVARNNLDMIFKVKDFKEIQPSTEAC